MSVQLSSTTASSCVLTPSAASHVNVLLDLPNTIPPALVSGEENPYRKRSCSFKELFSSSSVGIRRQNLKKKKSGTTESESCLSLPFKQSILIPTFPQLLLIDNNECTSDINLCGSKGICQNTPGSFTCECQRGFSLDQSGASCEGG